MAKKLINKQHKKLYKNKCFFCEVNDYDLLDIHRIVPGSEGGIYSNFNSLVNCKNCHALIHAGKIKIDRKYYSTDGTWRVHYWMDGVEYWKSE